MTKLISPNTAATMALARPLPARRERARASPPMTTPISPTAAATVGKSRPEPMPIPLWAINIAEGMNSFMRLPFSLRRAFESVRACSVAGICSPTPGIVQQTDDGRIGEN
jgi:hypothetical protein